MPQGLDFWILGLSGIGIVALSFQFSERVGGMMLLLVVLVMLITAQSKKIA